MQFGSIFEGEAFGNQCFETCPIMQPSLISQCGGSCSWLRQASNLADRASSRRTFSFFVATMSAHPSRASMATCPGALDLRDCICWPIFTDEEDEYVCDDNDDKLGLVVILPKYCFQED